MNQRKNISKAERLPKSLHPLLPEYDFNELNVLQAKNIIATRILEHGTIQDIRWMNKTYSEQDIKDILIIDGYRLLSKKTVKFWCIYFEIPYPPPSWRKNNPTWGAK